MSYLTFLLAFLIPPTIVLALIQPKPMAAVGARETWKWLFVLCGIAFAYTTPWDNYLVYREVWDYGSDRVLGTIGYVPLEEYIFFLLQPLMTGLWVSLLLGSRAFEQPGEEAPRGLRASYVGFWLVLAGLGVMLLTGTRSFYLGLILTWASPVLAGMAWLSTPLFWKHRRIWALGIAVPTLYLWVADRTAIGLGIWDISDTYSLGFDPLGLPIEEVVFFLVTNVLVVQGLLMFLPQRFSVLQ